MRRQRDLSMVVAAAAMFRRNWLAGILLATGLALRILTLLAYRPAIFYIDTFRYLYQAQGNDPVGYRVPLRAILAVGNLNMVAAVQHLLGLAMAVTIYVVLLRLRTPRWLAALAMAPVLLDAFQLQIEQMIMPDIWFEALIAAGIVVLLAGPAASKALGRSSVVAADSAAGGSARALDGPALSVVVIAGLILGTSATIRQVGEILVVPALAYLVVLSGGWRRVLTRASALAAAFALPILAYSTVSYVATGHFWLSHSGVTTTYGRMAAAADCATLRLPAVERALCPTAAQRELGPDGLEHSPSSPRVPYYTGPLSAQASHLVADFSHRVLVQQPQRVAAAIARDAVKLFAVTRTTSRGDTPISRWQFQTSYPYLAPHATRPAVLAATASYGGGAPKVWRPVATFLRSYQRDGGFTPGSLLAFCVLAGLAGSVLALTMQVRATRRRAARAGAPRADAAQDGAVPDGIVLDRAVPDGAARAGAARDGAALDRAARDGAAPDGAVLDGAARGGAVLGGAALDGAALGGAMPDGAARDGAAPLADADPIRRQLALACLLFFGCAAAVLLMSDVFEFSWRYQLPALVTLPPAGALAVAAFTTRRPA